MDRVVRRLLEEDCAMIQAALALTAVAALASPAGSSLIRPAPNPACAAASIDPSFVRYVPPALAAKGDNPLWLLILSGRQTQGQTPAGAEGLGCVRAIQVRDNH
jgi:hypothetical protein